MGIMFSQYLKVALNCAQLMKNHWNRFCVKEQHDKHTFRILHVSLNFIIHEVFIKTWKTVFIFRTCTCQTYALVHIYYSYIHIYIYMYIYIYTHTHIYIYICVCAHAKSLQSCPTLYDSMVYSPLGSSVHGILQTRLLEWVAMPSFRGSFWSRDQAHISYETTSLTSPALAGGYFTTSATWEAPNMCVCVCVCVYINIYIYIHLLHINKSLYIPSQKVPVCVVTV